MKTPDLIGCLEVIKKLSRFYRRVVAVKRVAKYKEFSLFVNRRVTLGCNMSLNVRLPHSSTDKGERFHQEILNMEKT